jgi:hypothetical protein
MGIRIHKVLGYGLVDFKFENWKFVDERFNDIQPFIYDENPESWNISNYIKWLKKFDTFDAKFESISLKEEPSTENLADCFVHKGEYGDPNIFVIMPPVFRKQWRRYDDIIDYYGETQCVNWHKVLYDGIQPYTGNFIDNRSGKEVVDGIAYFTFRNKKFKDELAKKLGFKDSRECDKYLTPKIPECVKYLCEYCNLFKDKSTVWQLKPMIYTYWS